MDTIKDVHNVNIKENRCLKKWPFDFSGRNLHYGTRTIVQLHNHNLNYPNLPPEKAKILSKYSSKYMQKLLV